jgi:UDP-glucose 4-epimerase
MTKILITGANSYIGTSFKKWLEQWPSEYLVDTISVRGDEWTKKDFSEYEVVFHVAGIAHVSTDPKMEDLYYKINRDLTIQVAKKAKTDGVKQFIFMSSIIVYGDSSHINYKRVITKDTVPEPGNFYGKSKLEAEEGIMPLGCDTFNVVVLRPPMIFGKGSKGNYPKLARMAQTLPMFPAITNERSMLHIDNLCEFIRLMIVHTEKGIFYPQNLEYVSTSQLVQLIAEAHGKKIRLTKAFNWALRLMDKNVSAVNKAFGNLVYEKSMSEYKENYRIRDLTKAIELTEV